MKAEDKAREIARGLNFSSDYPHDYKSAFDGAILMSKWKDEQFAQEKQQLIEKAVIFLNERVCTEMSIPEIHNMIVDFKKSMKGE